MFGAGARPAARLALFGAAALARDSTLLWVTVAVLALFGALMSSEAGLALFHIVVACVVGLPSFGAGVWPVVCDWLCSVR